MGERQCALVSLLVHAGCSALLVQRSTFPRALSAWYVRGGIRAPRHARCISLMSYSALPIAVGPAHFAPTDRPHLPFGFQHRVRCCAARPFSHGRTLITFRCLHRHGLMLARESWGYVTQRELWRGRKPQGPMMSTKPLVRMVQVAWCVHCTCCDERCCTDQGRLPQLLSDAGSHWQLHHPHPRRGCEVHCRGPFPECCCRTHLHLQVRGHGVRRRRRVCPA